MNAKLLPLVALVPCACSNDCSGAVRQDAPEKPNILIIMTDQQSYNTVSALSQYYPGEVYASTPNIDRLVRNGLSFTRAYCANPLSAPSRFALFTGRYPGHLGKRRNTDTPAEEPVRAIQENSGMGTVFRAAGYETIYGGKVHLDYSNFKPGATSMFSAPTGYGFDNYYIKDEREPLAEASARMLHDLAAKQKEDGNKPFLMVVSFLNPHDICKEYSTNLSDEIIPDQYKPEISETIAAMRARMKAIDENLFYGSIAPALPANRLKTADFPNTQKQRFVDYPDTYWRQYRWIYGQLVSLVDSHIGIVLDALDSEPELLKNTLVVFTSDHGEMQGAHGTGTKSLPFEECQKIPFIFTGAGVSHRGVSGIPVCNGTDLLPTLCEMAGLETPAGLDGVSLASVIKTGKAGKSLKSRKYIFSEGETFVTVWSDNYKFTYYDLDNGKTLLIDLGKDPGEMKNVGAQYPAVADKLSKVIAER